MGLAHPARFELTTSAFGGQRSIQLSYGCVGPTILDRRVAFNRTARTGRPLRLGYHLAPFHAARQAPREGALDLGEEERTENLIGAPLFFRHAIEPGQQVEGFAPLRGAFRSSLVAAVLILSGPSA